MKKVVIFIFILVHSVCYAQVDTRPVVGVAKFSCDEHDKYTGLVTEKVVEMLTNTKRFRVVDRTSYDRLKSELELQKSESFMDSDNRVEQDIAISAEKMITGHINKIPVYAMKNSNGTISGYKASVSFQMKVVDVATSLSTEAASFDGKASKPMLSPESAVTHAMQSLQEELETYFKKNFPVTGKILKILEDKSKILINIGNNQGLKKGDKLTVQLIETLDGKPYPTTVATITVIKLSGDHFAECEVAKKGADIIIPKFKAGETLICSLIIK